MVDICILSASHRILIGTLPTKGVAVELNDKTIDKNTKRLTRRARGPFDRLRTGSWILTVNLAVSWFWVLSASWASFVPPAVGIP